MNAGMALFKEAITYLSAAIILSGVATIAFGLVKVGWGHISGNNDAEEMNKGFRFMVGGLVVAAGGGLLLAYGMLGIG